jgi:hypothetical protein
MLWPRTGIHHEIAGAFAPRLFDIGLAGPLASFIMMLPIAFAGVLTVHHGGATAGGVYFGDPRSLS